MSKIENPFTVMEILKDELPKCFKRGKVKLPLAIGIHEKVWQHYANDKRFSKSMLQKAIHFYCSSSQYLINVVEGIPRIDLNGKTASKVTAREQKHAKDILKKRKALSKDKGTENRVRQ